VISMGGLTVLPNRNLISNIGFGEDATHTTDGRVTHQMQGGISELVHPSFLVIDREADAYTFHHHIAGKFLRYKSSFKGLLFDPLVQRFKIAFKNPTHYPQKIFDRFFASR
jgi:hypothetical protein